MKNVVIGHTGELIDIVQEKAEKKARN